MRACRSSGKLRLAVVDGFRSRKPAGFTTSLRLDQLSTEFLNSVFNKTKKICSNGLLLYCSSGVTVNKKMRSNLRKAFLMKHLSVCALEVHL